MTDLYITWVKANPMLSAAVQFGILGTAGEIASTKLTSGKLRVEGTAFQVMSKVLAWAFLGIIIKYGFVGMKGFVQALCSASLVPVFLMTGIGKAFLLSAVTNILFGPQMMLFHRFEENLIMGESGYQGMEGPLKTLIWFWIPAHTITFALPKVYQIGLAACWSVVLGVIMGMSSQPKEPQQ